MRLLLLRGAEQGACLRAAIADIGSALLFEPWLTGNCLSRIGSMLRQLKGQLHVSGIRALCLKLQNAPWWSPGGTTMQLSASEKFEKVKTRRFEETEESTLLCEAEDGVLRARIIRDSQRGATGGWALKPQPAICGEDFIVSKGVLQVWSRFVGFCSARAVPFEDWAWSGLCCAG